MVQGQEKTDNMRSLKYERGWFNRSYFAFALSTRIQMSPKKLLFYF